MSVVSASVIVIGAAACAIAAMLLVRRGAPEGSYFADGDRAAGVFGGFAQRVGDAADELLLARRYAQSVDRLTVRFA